MLTSQIMSLINEAEEMFPVTEWTWRGVHIWPFVRVRLNFELLQHFQVCRTERGLSLRAPRSLSQAMHSATGFARCMCAKWSDSGKNDGFRRADILFLSDGASFSREGKTWVEKFCDPIAERLEKDGSSGVLLTPLHHYHVPRRTPSIFIQPALDRAASLAMITLRSSRRKALRELAGYKEFSAWLGQHVPGMPARGEEWLTRSMTLILALSREFRRMLDSVRPALAMQVSYYSTIGMAFNIACRESEVPVFDLQHGVQGELHVAYGQWNKIPATGYAMLPRYFWCWSRHEVGVIHSWAKQCPAHHQPVVGGNPYLEMWRHGTAAVVRECDARLDSIMPRGRSQLQILVTLQFGFVSETELGSLLTAIRRTVTEWDWWVRMHPVMTDAERAHAYELFVKAGVSRERISLASELPLYALLRYMQVHVTHSSSTVIEAAQFGVPSVIISRYGGELYPSYIRDGMATVSLDPETLVGAIRRTRGIRKVADESVNEDLEAWRLCRDILTSPR